MFKLFADIADPSYPAYDPSPIGNANYLVATIVGIAVIATVAGVTIAILAKGNKAEQPQPEAAKPKADKADKK